MADADRKPVRTLLLLVAGVVLLTLLLPPLVTRHKAESWRATAELLGSDAGDHEAYLDATFKVGDSRESVEEKLVRQGRASAIQSLVADDGSYKMKYFLRWRPGSQICVEGTFDKKNTLTGKLTLARLLTGE